MVFRSIYDGASSLRRVFFITKLIFNDVLLTLLVARVQPAALEIKIRPSAYSR